MLSRSVIFITVHKGASTFVADELGRYLVTSEKYSDFRPIGSLHLKGREFSEMGDWPSDGLVTVRTYPAETKKLLADDPSFAEFLKSAAIVFLQRDPRDTSVSLFYSKAYSHTPNVIHKERFLEDRKRLQEMPPLEGIREMTSKRSIVEFRQLHRLHREHGGLMTRYEDLISDPGTWFESVGEHVGWPTQFVQELTERFTPSFAPPDAEDPMEHKRRITPGNWKEVFDDELLSEFNDEIGHLLTRNGYT